MDYSIHLEAWKQALINGEISDTSFSPLTISDYSRRIELLLSEYGDLTLDTFKSAIRAIDPKMLGKKAKLYKAVVCFAKFLHSENIDIDKRLVIQDGSIPMELRPFRPKKNKRPKQTVVSSKNLSKLKKACLNDFERLIITFLSNTGLRASEACAITIGDCDLSELVISNIKGKGGKTRKVALMPACAKAIKTYLLTRPNANEFQSLLIAPDGKVLNRYDLNRILNAIGKRIDVKVTPHSLRRAFVTISHAKGAPLDDLRLSCGHSDIKTTQGYCKTQESEMLERMKKMEIIPDDPEEPS